jgi:hypothetical protein
MGVLGWTSEQTLAETPYMIRLARRGRLDLINQTLQAIFGKPKESGGPLSGSMAPTPENFRRLFAAINEDAGP